MGDINPNENNNGQPKEQNVDQSQNQQQQNQQLQNDQSPNQQPQNDQLQYQQPRNDQTQNQQPLYQQPQYNGQSQYQQSQGQQNPYQQNQYQQNSYQQNQYQQAYTQYQQPYQKQNNSMAIASLVCGIIGILLSCCLVGILASIPGLILGILSLKNKTGDRTMAIIGIVLSSIGIIFVIFMIIIFAVSGATDPSYFDSIQREIENSYY